MKKNFKISIYPTFSVNYLYRKKDGNSLILPHYLAVHQSGEITLNEEYSEYNWVQISKLDEFEPKIPEIPHILKQMLRLEKIAKVEEFILI